MYGESTPKISLVKPENPITVTIHESTKEVRPIVVAAILRNLNFNQDRYNSFIELQDLLHNNICRKRTLVSMGTHDLDNVEGNISYEAQPPSEILFRALKQDEELTAEELFEVLKKDLKLKPYLPIIKDKPNYPVFYDENRTVLSLPPIINSEATKISPDTKNCFIEITGTDENRCNITLAILVSQFAQYCETPFQVEQVRVVYPDGREVMTPVLNYHDFEVDVDYVNKRLGIELSIDDQVKNCCKMGHEACKLSDSRFKVTVSPVRADVLHACDIAEDIGVAFGFNNIP